MSPKKLTLLLASTLTVMSGATISAALPSISDQFSSTEGVNVLVPLVLTVPALFIAVCSPLAGYLVDRLGRLRLLYLGLLLYAVGGTAGAFVNDLYLLLASRALLGVAVALVMTTVATLIADYFEGDERSDLLGKQAAAMSLGGILFISGGGVLADVSWRAPFFVYLLSLLLLPAISTYLNEPERVVEGDAGAGAIHAEDEQVNWPMVLLLFFTMLVTMIIFYLTPVFLPFLLTDFGVNASLVGLSVAGTTFTGAVASFLFARARRGLGSYRLLALAFALLGAGYVLVPVATDYLGVTVTVLISGFGLGFIMPNVNQEVMRLAPVRQRGRLLGLLSTCLFVGQFASPLLARPLIDTVGLAHTFAYAGVVALGMAALFYLLSFRVRVHRAG
jgi:MFS family permease